MRYVCYVNIPLYCVTKFYLLTFKVMIKIVTVKIYRKLISKDSDFLSLHLLSSSRVKTGCGAGCVFDFIKLIKDSPLFDSGDYRIEYFDDSLSTCFLFSKDYTKK